MEQYKGFKLHVEWRHIRWVGIIEGNNLERGLLHERERTHQSGGLCFEALFLGDKNIGPNGEEGYTSFFYHSMCTNKRKIWTRDAVFEHLKAAIDARA